MNISQSESQCNSGCESGWTHYLDQSYFSQSQFQRAGGIADYEGAQTEVEEEEEEDLSMVSDASSGPPHYHDLDEDCLYENGCSFSVSWGSKLEKKSKKKGKESGRQQHLDDTASSPVLNYSKKKLRTLSKDESSMQNVLGYSDGFSATHMRGKSALLQHFGFLKSSLGRSPASQKPAALVISKEKAGSEIYTCR